ncbi:hypothetical protein ACRAWC_24900 [Leifsonia sp. L25]|uniref:hypothetical protein n=1 Tax=Leifsonia sp. L25 TaxID=3423957 RepID=UPI003D695343
MTIVGSTSAATRSASQTEGEVAVVRRDAAVPLQGARRPKGEPAEHPAPNRTTAPSPARRTIAHVGKRPG